MRDISLIILPQGFKPKRRPRRYQRLNGLIAGIHAEYLGGATPQALALKYNSCASSIRRALVRYNPALRLRGPAYIDETGHKYGRLNVTGYAYSKDDGVRVAAHFYCVCLCGSEVVKSGYQLRQGRTLSCGCKKSENPRRKLF